MSMFFFVNKIFATIGGIIIIYYELSEIYERLTIHRNKTIPYNRQINFSYFALLSFSYMFFNILSSTKNYVANSLRGFMGCFLITYSLLYFSKQLMMCLNFFKMGSPNLREAIYLCVFLFLYVCSLFIETYHSLKAKHITEGNETGTVKIEV
ncbi:conserved Plasmodium protein, unknown function [Plasmodium relictum]|uniref:Uncharacterized protein n=1 Tax=Plasmodium relictum TaxID=85471 RepID=A0A1J1H659_PLARL|nr:conserved Plasmodium protein, unknown function [Plasmodium relictum]CRH00422.1 conserved Plasmodium protein, unknown function [Plasmodium relictum]